MPEGAPLIGGQAGMAAPRRPGTGLAEVAGEPLLGAAVGGEEPGIAGEGVAACAGGGVRDETHHELDLADDLPGVLNGELTLEEGVERARSDKGIECDDERGESEQKWNKEAAVARGEHGGHCMRQPGERGLVN